jgi:tetracycline 7-halogenase / FADH2 O2-dependent halogenase
VSRGERAPGTPDLSANEEWLEMMNRYPSLAKQFASAKLVAPERGLIRTGRLQRRAAQAAGENWAALPNTAGFVDPLFSTGIAHSLCGVERLIRILERHWSRPTLAAELDQYQETVLTEVDVIDEIVGSCFAAFSCFETFVACCMAYFAAATTFERRRLDQSQAAPRGSFLCADDSSFGSIARQTRARVMELMNSPTSRDIAGFRAWLQHQLAPYNHVGLFEPRVTNMYHHTALPS